MPSEKLDYSQKVLLYISQCSMLETETLDILRRKRFLYYEELGASKFIGRVGGETLKWASRMTPSRRDSSRELLPLT